jgi:hypothetical protein
MALPYTCKELLEGIGPKVIRGSGNRFGSGGRDMMCGTRPAIRGTAKYSKERDK